MQPSSYFFSSFDPFAYVLEIFIEIPSALPMDQFRFLRNALRKVLFLKLPHAQGDCHPFVQRVKREFFVFQRISSTIEMDAAVLMEANGRDGFLFRDCFIPKSLAYRENRVTDHLGAKPRIGSDFEVGEVVQSHPIPAAVFNSKWNDLITGQKISLLKLKKFLALFLRSFKSYANRPFHGLKGCPQNILFATLNREQRFLPALKDWEEALSIG
jgi:hypothetical protein